ncbi:hypothetical protein GCM10023091_11730 [Ravibacter arvi]|uniref:LPS export ABC transporter periplasmic protein LptC n=1 Tax=Ravibacter arvi TaxID=2051041 RepID=A0ABP8LVA5_9BACT
MRKLLLAVITGLVLGCSTPNKVPFTNYTVFTEELRKDLESAGIPLEKVQFYNDKMLVIKREGVNPNDIGVTSEGKISIQNGKSVHTITIRPFTPGVSLSAEAGKINASWDDSQQDKDGIPFVITGNQYYLSTTEDSKINYKDNLYDVQSGVGARLFVSKDLLKQVNSQRETLKGRRVGGEN